VSTGASQKTLAEKSLEAQAALVDRLDLEELDQDLYRGYNEPLRTGRIFGGQVAAQSLMAAGRTVDDLLAHSLHGYFLRAGDPEIPIIYTVDRIRDGRSFVTRRVVAKQRGKAIFNMSCSFHKFEAGPVHQIQMPDAPDPESIPSWTERFAEIGDKLPERIRKVWQPGSRPIDTRELQVPVFLGGEAKGGDNMVWLRTPGPLPDDPFLHQCVLAYATDFSLIDTMIRQHKEHTEHTEHKGRGPAGASMTASLDHAIWFHAPLRIDDWLLYHQDCPVTFGARGFARGTIYTRDGRLVASAVQEGLIRPVAAPDADDRSI
jgi:acyl-CoA thioesterase-2